jgi:hypothetical protein
MNKNRILGLLVMVMFAVSSFAQMTFTFAGGATAKEVEMPDGSMLLQLPAGTDLNSAITGVKVGGNAVEAASVVPNPTTTFITDGEIETFVYDGKAYSFRFIAGEYFTAVMFSDPHVAQDNYSGTSVADMQALVSEILKIGKEGGKEVTFDNAPKGFVPTADIVFCLGDMDKDSESSGNNFKNAMKGFNDAGVPFITIAGNHDLRPDYWHDSDKSAALTALTMSDYIFALNLVREQYTKAAEYGKFKVDGIADSRKELISPGHFSFKFRGVRFYCANNYWFQKPYYAPLYSADSIDVNNMTEEELTALFAFEPYAADGVIDALNSYVEAHTDDASIWVSHYPFYSEANDYNDAYERWWLDQNNAPYAVCYKPVDAASSRFYNGDNDLPKYTTSEGQAIVAKKQKALADIIVKSKNPRHFSGHSHRDDGMDVTATNGTQFRDHTVKPFFEGEVFVVLCKEGVGAIEVKRVYLK